MATKPPMGLRNKHGRIKRRIALGMGKPGDQDKLVKLEQRLGYR